MKKVNFKTKFSNSSNKI